MAKPTKTFVVLFLLAFATCLVNAQGPYGPPNWGCPEQEIACYNHCLSLGYVFGDCTGLPFRDICICR
uniref:Putative secreted protein n=1 Tax=Ixodes ricinus TaxID=34613 RepID=A0A131Y5N7_IXORI